MHFGLIRAIQLEGKSDALDAGTTTLLCGVIVELTDSDKQEQYRYAFVCASVGDCKAFLWSPARKKVSHPAVLL